MLKIRLENPQESEAIERLLRDLIQQDRSYVAGFIGELVDVQTLEELSGQNITARVVQGLNVSGETYSGLILHGSLSTADPRGVLASAHLPFFVEKPLVFASVQDAKQIWPHLTLEDRLIDATLFALAGYDTPKTAKLVSLVKP